VSSISAEITKEISHLQKHHFFTVRFFAGSGNVSVRFLESISSGSFAACPNARIVSGQKKVKKSGPKVFLALTSNELERLREKYRRDTDES